MKRNGNKEFNSSRPGELPLPRSPAANSSVFLILAVFLLAVAVLVGKNDLLPQKKLPPQTGMTERYVWLTGASMTPGLYVFTAEQLAHDFSGIGGLLTEVSTPAGSPMVAAMRIEAGILKPCRLPPQVANVFFAPIPINRADVGVLTSLPGIGPVLAEKIVQHRREQGPFRTKDELLHIAGIGPQKYAALADRITLD